MRTLIRDGKEQSWRLPFSAVQPGHRRAICCSAPQSNAQFSKDGKYLLISNGNKKPTLWNVDEGKLVAKFDAGDRVFYSKFSPDGTMVATSDFEGVTKDLEHIDWRVDIYHRQQEG